jgi:hypothetical protein
MIFQQLQPVLKSEDNPPPPRQPIFIRRGGSNPQIPNPQQPPRAAFFIPRWRGFVIRASTNSQ